MCKKEKTVINLGDAHSPRNFLTRWGTMSFSRTALIHGVCWQCNSPLCWCCVNFISFLQFIDLCILLGCDYCDSIKGIGPKRAMDLIKQHRSLETVLKNIDRNKYSVTDDWMYSEARLLFQEPEVISPDEIEVSFSHTRLRTVTCVEIYNSNEGRRCKLKIPFYNIGSSKVSMVTGLWDRWVQVLGPTQPPIQWVQVSFPGAKFSGAWIWTLPSI